MQCERHAAVLLAMLLAVLPAQAASTAEELERIEAEHAVLKARLRVLETRAQMAARRADIDRLTATSPQDASPTVAAIDGLGEKLRATVVMESGQMVEVTAGERLPNGWRVVSIRRDGVVVADKANRQQRLQPGAEPDARAPAARWSGDGGSLPVPVSAAADRLAVMPPLPARPGAPR